MTKKLVAVALSLVAVVGAPFAHAESEYQPYYYVPAATASAAIPPAANVNMGTAVGQVTATSLCSVTGVVTERTFSNVLSDFPTSAASPATIPSTVPTPVYQPDVVTRNTLKPKFKGAEVGTRSGIDFALQVSNYHYREPSLDVSLAGEKGGVDMTATGKFWGDNFATFDFRAAMGSSDYSGSGTSPNKFERLFDVRALIGHDFKNDWYSFSPYVGYGYRNLYSDGRGVSSTGASGYERNNVLYYLPVGLTQRIKVSDTASISLMGEYDYVYHGVQTSYFSEYGGPDIYNVQKHGNGYRTEFMWNTPRWSVGPFANYWAMAESEVAHNKCGPAACFTWALEPHNNTLEAGLQVKFHGFDF